MQLKKQSEWPGGMQDYRPSYLGLKQTGKTAGVFVEYAREITFKDIKVYFVS